MPAFRDRTSWYLGLSAYWFAASFKWFILLLAVLPAQVRAIVPEGEANTQWGLVFALGSIWAMVGPAVFGYLSDRLAPGSKRRAFIGLGAALTVIALAFLAKADSLAVLIVGYLLLQVSDDVGTGPYGATIPELVPIERRGKASGVMGMLQQFGQLASGIAGIALGGDPMKIYAGIAVVNILCAIWTMSTMSGTEIVGEPPENRKPSLKDFVGGWAQPWKSADFRWVWLTRFLVALGYYMVQPYLANYLRDRVQVYQLFGMTLEKDPTKTTMPVAVLGLTIALFGGLSASWSARRADQIGRKAIVRSSGVVMIAALIPFALIPNFTVLWVLALVFGVGYGAYISADWALASDVMPSTGDVGKDMGVWIMSVSCVQLVGGAFGSVIDSLNRVSMGMGYTSVFIAAGVAFLFGTALVSRVKGST